MTFAAVVFWLAEYEQRRLRKLVQQCCWSYSRVYMMCWDDLQQVINLVSGFSVCCLKCIDVWAEIETMTSSRDDAPRWWSAVMTNWRWAEIYEQRWAMVQKSWWDEQRRWAALICQRFLVGYMNLLYCKSKLVLLLRLGYLNPFLAGSKKTKQGPGLRVGALFISRCWFRLTVVAEQII